MPLFKSEEKDFCIKKCYLRKSDSVENLLEKILRTLKKYFFCTEDFLFIEKCRLIKLISQKENSETILNNYEKDKNGKIEILGKVLKKEDLLQVSIFLKIKIMVFNKLRILIFVRAI